jgi:hypothetical protein
MDTVGDNSGLLKLRNTEGLPAHYDNATLSLFQIDVNYK